MLSLIIPTLKTPENFSENLQSLMPHVDEVVISAADIFDPGVRSVSDWDIQIMASKKGRGSQLANGAMAASGDWLLFLHADTFLEKGWELEIRDFMKVHPDKAAYFRFALDEQGDDAKWLEKSVAWRCRAFSLPYGDQGLLISKEHYQQIGGFPDISLMEDVTIVRKIGKKRLVGLRSKAITSAEKFKGGYKFRSLRNLFCLLLFFMKVPPRLIKKVYG